MGKMTSTVEAALREQLANLQAENERLKTKRREAARKRQTLKVSQKGAVSLYGIRRFPLTFYAQEWDKVLDMAQEIRDFIADHRDELTFRE